MRYFIACALAASSLLGASPTHAAVNDAGAPRQPALRIAKVLLDVAHDADPEATVTFDVMKIGRRNALLALNENQSKDFNALFDAEWQAWRNSVEEELAQRQASRFEAKMSVIELQSAAAFLETAAGRHFLVAMRSPSPAKGKPLVNGYRNFEDGLKAKLLVAGMKYE